MLNFSILWVKENFPFYRRHSCFEIKRWKNPEWYTHHSLSYLWLCMCKSWNCYRSWHMQLPVQFSIVFFFFLRFVYCSELSDWKEILSNKALYLAQLMLSLRHDQLPLHLMIFVLWSTCYCHYKVCVLPHVSHQIGSVQKTVLQNCLCCLHC